MRSFIVVALFLSALLTAGAQEPPKQTPGDKCLADLPQWQTYAGTIKTSRDTAEQDLATWKARAEALRLEVDKLTKRVAELEKK